MKKVSLIALALSASCAFGYANITGNHKADKAAINTMHQDTDTVPGKTKVDMVKPDSVPATSPTTKPVEPVPVPVTPASPTEPTTSPKPATPPATTPVPGTSTTTPATPTTAPSMPQQ